MSTETYSDPLQEEIVRRLRGWSELAGLNISHEEDKDLVKTIQNNLLKLGIAIIVGAPAEDCTAKQITRPVYDRVQITVDVVENVLFNRAATGSQLPCKAIAKRVVSALWLFRPEGMSGALVADTPVIRSIPSEQYSIFRVQFKIGE
jgi:hypothetical protein